MGINIETFVVLLRGINVGKHRLLPMAQLKEQLEAAGFSKVTTYIRSGNVILQSQDPSPLTVSERIADVIKAEYGFAIPVIVYPKATYERFHREIAELAESVAETQQLVYGYSQAPLSPSARRVFVLGQEEAWIHGSVLVMRIGLKLSDSPLMKQVGRDKALQHLITVRNQQTSHKLLALLEAYD